MFTTIQAKIALMIGILSVFFSLYEGLSWYLLFLQFLGYFIIAKNAECLVNGKCYTSSWFSLTIPIIGLILSAMYRISYFKKYEKYLNSFIKNVNEINETRYNIKPSISIDNIQPQYQRVINLNSDLTNTKKNDLDLKINESQTFSDNSDDLNDINRVDQIDKITNISDFNNDLIDGSNYQKL
jgi:hypothetical protein